LEEELGTLSGMTVTKSTSLGNHIKFAKSGSVYNYLTYIGKIRLLVHWNGLSFVPLEWAMSYGSSFVRMFSGSFSLLSLKASMDSRPRVFSTEKLKEVVIKILKHRDYDADLKLIGDLPRHQCKV
jgi:hypothetical protein